MADMAEVASSASTTTTTTAASAAVHKLIARKMLAIEKFRKSIAFRQRRFAQKKAKLAKQASSIDKATKALRKRRFKAKALGIQLRKQELEFPPLEVSIGEQVHELDEYFEAHRMLLDPCSSVPDEVRALTRAACCSCAKTALVPSLTLE